jgi:negative regulator of flagellin synthesis FlgM
VTILEIERKTPAMTIERIGPMDPMHSMKKPRGPAQSNKADGADSISLSQEAKSKGEIYQATELAKNSPEIRWELVEAAKQKLQDPNYISEKVVDAVAQRLMEYFEIT